MNIKIERNPVRLSYPRGNMLQLRDVLHYPQASGILTAGNRREQLTVLIGQTVNAVLITF
ncbi:hypothetical protein D3C73_1636070 [compost metagenome]